MRIKLFWKIFIWFWLTIITIVSVFLFVNYLNTSRTNYLELSNPINKKYVKDVKRTKRLFQHKKKRINLKRERLLKHIYLLNRNGEDYFERSVPHLLEDLHVKVKRKKKPLLIREYKSSFFGGKKIRIEDTTYWIYTKHHHGRFTRHMLKRFFDDMTTSLFISIFIVSFPISFFLSWMIVRPIKNLQDGIRDIQEDLSDRKNIELLTYRKDEFGELALDFNHMADHLSQMLSSQKQLIGDVSHELRTPLTRLKIALGMAENNLQKNSLEDIQHNLERIQLESNRMNEMLENLLTLSSLDTQEINAKKEKFNLCQTLESVIEDASFEASQSDIKIIFNKSSDCYFNGIKSAFISGFENILRNAIKYAGENGKVLCELEIISDSILLSVSDTGPGVPDDQLEKLFVPFYRPDTDRSRNSGGIGLGLSIAKRAFALNSGKIKAKNEEPHGLKIEIIFPKN